MVERLNGLVWLAATSSDRQRHSRYCHFPRDVAQRMHAERTLSETPILILLTGCAHCWPCLVSFFGQDFCCCGVRQWTSLVEVDAVTVDLDVDGARVCSRPEQCLSLVEHGAKWPLSGAAA